MEVLQKINSNYDRVKGASWFNSIKDREILVIGAGGIASWLSLLIARAGANIIIYDEDIIEQHNLSGQLYKNEDVGTSKVEAISKIIDDFVEEGKIEFFEEMYTQYSPSNPVVLTGLDNMKARKIAFENWLKFLQENPQTVQNSLFIDGRLNAESLQIYCIKGTDLEAQKLYQKEALFGDEEVEPQDCTFKQTSHCAAMIASHMCGFLTNFFGEEFREVPYFYCYKIPINFTIDESE